MNLWEHRWGGHICKQSMGLAQFTPVLFELPTTTVVVTTSSSGKHVFHLEAVKAFSITLFKYYVSGMTSK